VTGAVGIAVTGETDVARAAMIAVVVIVIVIARLRLRLRPWLLLLL
jgi:hypothetical protein